MRFLLDTNVIAEIRKGARANANVRAWFAGLEPDAILLSVLTIGELEKGVARLAASARKFLMSGWLSRKSRKSMKYDGAVSGCVKLLISAM